MNVKDVTLDTKDLVEALGVETEDRLLLMVEQQKQLAEKYHHIEKNFRLTHECPVSLDDSKGQLLLKDFAWRATEEIAEALDALLHKENEDRILHAQEEVADAFHFILEMGILAGVDFENIFCSFEQLKGDRLTQLYLKAYNQEKDGLMISKHFGSINREALKFLRHLGMVCHTLKNKPWKTSQMLTDKKEFYARFTLTLEQFACMALAFGLDSEGLFKMYFRKAQVNLFRQVSCY